MELTAFRFRLLTKDSIGAYTSVMASSYSEAVADLTKQLTPWEFALPLHGPSKSLRSFY